MIALWAFGRNSATTGSVFFGTRAVRGEQLVSLLILAE